ncbi:MAG: ISAs1 family transposase [Anaerolineales bacterium]|nr:ISAs1 family transposase [Anaerolineales bacterium]
MVKEPISSLEAHFSTVTDPRGPNIEHLFFDIIAIAMLGTICGADGWVEIEQFGYQKLNWLSQYLLLPNGIPSHDTFGRVFSQIDPEEFQTSFMEWVKAVHQITQGQVIGIDGKQMRGSHDQRKGKRAIYMVSAWAEQNHLVLGQRKVAEKSNEITAIPELLRLLEIKGCIVTIDAIGTQVKIAKQITLAEGDYLLAVKQNQGKLFRDLEMLFSYDQKQGIQDAPYDHDKEVTKGHGRIDVRECWATSHPEYLASVGQANKWTGLRSLVMIIRRRIIDGEETIKTRFYISSLEANAKRILKATHQHWSIENGLHWVLDIAFNEDRSRVRKDHAPANLAVLRHMAVNLLKQETSAKGGIKAKCLQAGWNEDYLLKVLSGG